MAIIYLYESTTTDFIYNGQPFPKAYEVTVDRTINDEFFVTGKHPLDENNRYKLIQKDKIIKAHTPDGMQPFRIVDVNKRLGYVEFEAWPLLYADLRNKLIKPFKISNSSGQSALNTFINNLLLSTKFSFTSNILSNHDFSVRDETEAQEDPNQLYDALEVFKRIVNRWSGEIIINGYDIRLVSRLGKDTDALLYEKKNITDFVDKESIQGIVTRVHGKSEWTEDGPDGKQLTKRIKTTVDSPLINAYSGIVFEQQFTNNDIRTEQELKNWLTLKFSTENIDKPSRTIELDTNIVDETEVALGDKLNLKYLKHDVDMLIRMTKYQYDGFNNRYIKIFVGDALEHFTGSVQNTISVVETNIKNSVDKTIAHVIINQLGQKIIYSEYEPEGDYSEGDVWFDNKGGMFIWNEASANWIPHPFNNRMDAIGQEVTEAIKQADEDRTKAEKEINQAVIDAKNYTEVKAQEFNNQLLLVNQNVITATNSANAAVLKADKTIEDVGFLKPDVATAKANAATAIQDAATATQNATTAIQNAQTALNSVATLSQEVDVSITNINGELTRKVSQTTFNTLSGTVGTHTTQISQTQTALLAKAESSLVNTIKGTVDSHTTQIKVVSDGLELKAESSLVNTVKGTVDSHTSQINANSQAITARLTSVQIETLLTGKQYVNQTTFNATSTTLTAQITQVSTDLSNLEIGGTNLVYNSEIPPFSPINYNGGTYVVSKVLENVPFLNVSTVTEVSRTVGGGDFRPPDITIDDGRNREYTVSVWVRPVSPSVSLTLTLGVNDKEMTGKTVVLTDATKWIRVTYSKKFSANIDGTLLRVYLNLGENQKARFSKIKLEKGIKATDWSPSPNDMATLEKVVTIEANIDGINTLVASKASQAQVTQLAGQITTKVESATYNSKMTQLDSAINLRVVQGDVTAAILADKTIKDTRATNELPSWYFANYPKQTVEEFKTRNNMGGIPGIATFGQLTTKVLWNSTSGGSITQIFSSSDGVFQRQGNSGATAWLAWDKIAEAGKLISQINVSTEGILLQGKRIQLDGDVTMTAAFVTRLDVLALSAVYADIPTIRNKVLITDVVTTNMIKADAGLFDKVFINDAVVQKLTVKSSFISSVKAIDITADKVTGGTFNAALMNVVGLNANSMTTGTLNGANYSNNLNTGVETFRNPSNGSTLSIQQDKFYFNTSGASHYMIPDNEGLAFVPAAGNTGNDRNAGIRLQSANFNFVDLGIGNDGGFKYRIADYSSALTLISKNGGNFIFSHENITENNIGAHKWELLDGNYGKFKYGKTAFTMNGFSIYDVPKMSIYNDTTGKMGTLETQYLQLTSDSGQGLQLSPAGTSFKIAHNANRNWMFDEGLNGAITYGASRITLNGHNTGSAARLSIYNINGNYGFMSAANFDVQSERKYKDDIEDFGGALGIISTMKIHQYTKNGISEIGIITDEAPYQLLADNDTKVSLYDYASLAIRGVQELGDLTWHHEVKLSKHELRIKELEEKIKLLESVA